MLACVGGFMLELLGVVIVGLFSTMTYSGVDFLVGQIKDTAIWSGKYTYPYFDVSEECVCSEENNTSNSHITLFDVEPHSNASGFIIFDTGFFHDVRKKTDEASLIWEPPIYARQLTLRDSNIWQEQNESQYTVTMAFFYNCLGNVDFSMNSWIWLSTFG